VIRVLFRRGVVSIDDRDAEGKTALHVAAELGDEALVGLLLDKGASSQLQDYRGRLAVYYAVEKGHHEVVELLLDR
jgi:ankyrin repeat protein